MTSWLSTLEAFWSLLSPAPTAPEVENLPQSRNRGDRSQDADMEEEESIEHEERIEKEVSMNEEECIKDETKIQSPSDVALERAEYGEVCMSLAHVDFVFADSWKLAPLRGIIDLRYYYNTTRDAISVSTGRNTNSPEPGPAVQASTEDIIMRERHIRAAPVSTSKQEKERRPR